MPFPKGSKQKDNTLRKIENESTHSALTAFQETLRKCIPTVSIYVRTSPSKRAEAGVPPRLLRVSSTENITKFSTNSDKITRPATTEQIKRWENSFSYLLHDPVGLHLFETFLNTEFSQENIQFWKDCQNYRRLPSKDLETEAKNIYQLYLSMHSPREVNLDSKTRLKTISAMHTPNQHLFENAQRKIQALMEKDSFPRFLRSDVFLAFKREILDTKSCEHNLKHLDNVQSLLSPPTNLPSVRNDSQ